METFDFYLDTKVTTWYRTPFEIEATTLEEAKQKAIEFVENDGQANIPWDHIDGAIENMSVEENGGFATDELFCNDDVNLIWSNSTNEEQITTYGTK
jgi:hypothetical protein